MRRPIREEPLDPAANTRGFTLIELSIVLVIIGLIVGGILVGQDLIEAAGIRAQISQIEKYQTAVRTFQIKFNCLPGDCANAADFGFTPRGQYAGEGDGNGIIEGNNSNGGGIGSNNGLLEATGETVTFWVDLSQAGLIDGGFNTGGPTSIPSPVGGAGGDLTATTSPSLFAYFPPAKIGSSNWILVYSQNGINYFTLMGNPQIQPNGPSYGYPGLTVRQAYNIDTKIDDGLPQSGRVTTQFINGWLVSWARGDAPFGGLGADLGTAASPSAITCYDNGGNSSAPMTYSLGQNGGAGMNCEMSFQFE